MIFHLVKIAAISLENVSHYAMLIIAGEHCVKAYGVVSKVAPVAASRVRKVIVIHFFRD